jgi:flagellar protein FlbD
MILLRKINGAPIAVNSDIIEYIEETPDTVITLTNGDKVVVQESMKEIIADVVEYRRLIAVATSYSGGRRLRRVQPWRRG